jgi:hypothetical protein
MEIDEKLLDTVPIGKYGYPDWTKVYGKLNKKDLFYHQFSVKPGWFNDCRKNYPELYLIFTKEEADNKLLAYSSLLEQWRDQLTYIPSEEDPRVLELYDPDSEEGIPNLSDLIKLTQSTFMDLCLPIRNALELRRLIRRREYFLGRVLETEQMIEGLKSN